MVLAQFLTEMPLARRLGRGACPVADGHTSTTTPLLTRSCSHVPRVRTAPQDSPVPLTRRGSHVRRLNRSVTVDVRGIRVSMFFCPTCASREFWQWPRVPPLYSCRRKCPEAPAHCRRCPGSSDREPGVRAGVNRGAWGEPHLLGRRRIVVHSANCGDGDQPSRSCSPTLHRPFARPVALRFLQPAADFRVVK